MQNFLLIFLIILPHFLFAQAEILDSTFGIDGVASSYYYSYYSWLLPAEILLQPDGKILVNSDTSIYRFNEDGSLDSSFREKINIPEGSLTVGLRADGRILIAEGWQSQISQHNSNGSIDSSFGQQGTVSLPYDSAYPVKLLIQPDNKFLLLNAGWSGYLHLLRFSNNGSIDSSFGVNGIEDTWLDVVGADATLLPNGKIVVASSYWFSNSITILQINENGTPDSGFGSNGIVNFDKMTHPYAGGYVVGRYIAAQPDGKIILTGKADDLLNYFSLARINSDGTVDSTFGSGGLVNTAVADSGLSAQSNGVWLQSDGKILVAGTSSGYVAVGRYLPSGIPDSLFDFDGIFTAEGNSGYGWGSCVTIQPDGKILVGGSHDFDAVFRFTSAVNMGVEESYPEKNLLSVYPNPFSSSANISFSLQNNSTVSLQAFNLLGQKVNTMVQNEKQAAGKHQYHFIGIGEGIYFVKLTVDGISSSQKIICQK